MTITVEDGTGVAGANSYVTTEEYTAWANARFGDSRATLPANTAAYEAISFRAMDYLEAQNFKGSKTSDSQALQWPRSGVYIDGAYTNDTSIPNALKNAQFEIMYAEEKGIGPLSDIAQKVQKKKVGPLEITYAENSSSRTITPSISRSLSKLTTGGSAGGVNFTVRRG